jgi:8-oxo-dGTP pyrophosphatase MutT (NUDIX family)
MTKLATLALVIKRKKGEISEVLLGMKKRGFGVNLWNGFGGKFDSEKDKDLVTSVAREVMEEAGISIKNPVKVAELDYSSITDENWKDHVHAYFVEEWNGEPVETEEMRPQWFKVEDIPYDKMWIDDIFWIPRVLKGETLKGKFVFKGPGEIVEQELIPTSFK